MKILLMPNNHDSAVLSRKKANCLKNTNSTPAVHLIQTLYVITAF